MSINISKDEIKKCTKLVVSENKRFLQYENGEPFFYLGDTAWLLFINLTREEAEIYLEDRRKKGFNVIQAMLVHEMPERNIYGREPFYDLDFSKPDTSKIKDTDGNEIYSYWDHVDYITRLAAKKGMYIAMVPVWGSVVKGGHISKEGAHNYAKWIAERYKDEPNIIWFVGGDIYGYQHTELWLDMANTIKSIDRNHLMSFHPFGGTQSSTWFHEEPWLDFNMCQSGHRRYDQAEQVGNIIGEDNWKFIQNDYTRVPIKPTFDGEPSYEGIPHGLHDTSQPRWKDEDCRRYAYWAVFAGAFGHTFGNSAIMQMNKPNFGKPNYGVDSYWYEAINDSGASRMIHLKNLILSRPYFERIPDQSVIHGDEGFRYDRVIATRGSSYLFAYTYTGRPFEINMGIISGRYVNAWWYSPKDGSVQFIGKYENSGVCRFAPPGEKADGNDWVLVLDDAECAYKEPGVLE